VTGLHVLDKALATLEPKLQKKAIRKAARTAAKMILHRAKQLVPVDYGDLSESLKVKSITNLKGKRHRIGYMVVAGEGMFIGDVFYGGFVETGTKERYHKNKKYVGAMEETSYLRRPLYEMKEAVQQRFLLELDYGIREQASKARAATRLR